MDPRALGAYDDRAFPGYVAVRAGRRSRATLVVLMSFVLMAFSVCGLSAAGFVFTWPATWVFLTFLPPLTAFVIAAAMFLRPVLYHAISGGILELRGREGRPHTLPLREVDSFRVRRGLIELYSGSRLRRRVNERWLASPADFREALRRNGLREEY